MKLFKILIYVHIHDDSREDKQILNAYSIY